MPAEHLDKVHYEPLIALYRGVGVVSTLVRWQTRSIYSHAGIRLRGGSIIESWHRGGVKRNETLGTVHMPGTVVDLFRVAAPVDWTKALLFAGGQIGKGYDWRGCARFVTRREPDCNPQRWFCSSLVFAALEHGGVQLLARICPAAVAPAHLSLSRLLEQVGQEVTA